MTHDLTDLVLKYLEACELYDSGEDPEGESKEEMLSEIMSAHMNIADGDIITVSLGGEESDAVVAHTSDEDEFNFVIVDGEEMDIFDWIDSIA